MAVGDRDGWCEELWLLDHDAETLSVSPQVPIENWQHGVAIGYSVEDTSKDEVCEMQTVVSAMETVLMASTGSTDVDHGGLNVNLVDCAHCSILKSSEVAQMYQAAEEWAVEHGGRLPRLNNTAIWVNSVLANDSVSEILEKVGQKRYENVILGHAWPKTYGKYDGKRLRKVSLCTPCR